jgi:hypothetical protein
MTLQFGISATFLPRKIPPGDKGIVLLQSAEQGANSREKFRVDVSSYNVIPTITIVNA